jgi:hypothetical protein
MKASVWYGIPIVVSLIGGSSAWAQQAPVAADSAAQPAGIVPAVVPAATASASQQDESTGASAALASGPGNPNADKPPMSAQELTTLVPKDSSHPRPAKIDRADANSYYRYDKAGVNCSLYPARCQGQDNNY